jgi:magnesium-transporting ATPase (P-type)
VKSITNPDFGDGKIVIQQIKKCGLMVLIFMQNGATAISQSILCVLTLIAFSLIHPVGLLHFTLTTATTSVQSLHKMHWCLGPIYRLNII